MSNRRFSAMEKGKGTVTEPYQAPRKARVQVQVPDNSYLIQKHSLTLIGKVTNPTAQKVWALLPVLTERWSSGSRPIGSDLGQGMFQFQFSCEADLLEVLDKRPYLYAKWMLIVQRWEPSIAPDFPNLIPFWIKVQGIPLHLWTEEIIRSIGQDIGVYEEAEISTLTVRMRVQINGRLPLIKSSILELDNGEEVSATLVYEKLDKHCTYCHRLDHESRDCLKAKAEKREALALTNTNRTDKSQSASSPGRNLPIQQQRRSTSHSGTEKNQLRMPPPPSRYLSHEDNLEKTGQREESSASKAGHPHSARGTPLRKDYPEPPREAIAEAMGEIRDVMNQYTLCADPSESAARRERLRRAEEKGDFEEAAVQMARTSLATKTTTLAEDIVVDNAERIPALLRLGSPNLTPNPLEATINDSPQRTPVLQRLGPLVTAQAPDINQATQVITKRKPGRPPGKRTVQSSPKNTSDNSLRKRRVQATKPPPCRRRLPATLRLNSAEPKQQTKKTGDSQASGRQRTKSSSSDNQPLCKMIPATTKRKKTDFQSPSTLVP
ncbi:hypothetical protein BRARA_D01815 [Brassica rapa]|uniref:DUF4283 domain-containing protein n=1 Tax=Brassica campestris TaxID=3711 RepID=A0A397ZQS3_BRACM|nr:hypothetical protein BRARA_D01815 [Brassica rapa]